MEKQTKNIITKASVLRDLQETNRLSIRSSIFVCVLLGIVLIPMMVGVGFGVAWSLRRGFWVWGLLTSLFEVIFCLPIVINVRTLWLEIKYKKLLADEKFQVTVCEVLYKREKLVHRHIEECLYFKDFGEAVVGHTVYQLTEAGDKFYIAHCQGHKEPLAIYAAKMYEYEA